MDESKNVQTTPTRTYCKRNRPLPYYHPNCRTPRHWKFCESWTLTAELKKRTQVFEMKYYRRLLNISYKDHVTNGDVRRKILAVIGKYDELLTLVKKRKLRWFGHVSRTSGLAKSILQDTLQKKKKKKKKKKIEEGVGTYY